MVSSLITLQSNQPCNISIDSEMANQTTEKSVGVLVTNLGTPQAPTPSAVKEYLAEFLWDPAIVQIPRPVWWLILHSIILRVRPKKSAQLYQKIWTDQGSPLLVTSTELTRKLELAAIANQLSIKCVLGMRYGQPSLGDALQILKNKTIDDLIVLPLYPQFSKTTTASTLTEINQQFQQLNWFPKVHPINYYADDSSYIDAIAHSIQSHWRQQNPGQKLLFSFHGIPKRLTLQGDPYYDHCMVTATKVADALNLKPEAWQIVFQSRFGREQWLQPYCAEVLQSLPREGCKHIDIVCPGFPVDCLETLEEIALANKALFYKAGGLTYNYIPSLNASDYHIQMLLQILRNKLDSLVL